MINIASIIGLASTCREIKTLYKGNNCCENADKSVSLISLTNTFQCTHEDANIFPTDLNLVDLREPEKYILYQTNLHLHNIRQSNSERLQSPRSYSTDYGSMDGEKGRFYPFGCAVGLGVHPSTGLQTNESLVKYDEMYQLAAPLSTEPFDDSKYTSILPT